MTLTEPTVPSDADLLAAWIDGDVPAEQAVEWELLRERIAAVLGVDPKTLRPN